MIINKNTSDMNKIYYKYETYLKRHHIPKLQNFHDSKTEINTISSSANTKSAQRIKNKNATH